MNERLENLLYESGLTAQGCWDELDGYAKQGIERFAELIIEECIYACATERLGKTAGVEELIRQHFGVE
jgi:hypothetical protein